MTDSWKTSSSPPSLLSEETKRQIIQTATSVKDTVSDVVTNSYENWDVEGFEDGIPSAIDSAIDSLAHGSKAQQITAGGVTGWMTGFLFNKFGKPVLYLAGGAILIGLFAEHQGYLKIDWKKVRSDYSAGRRSIKDRVQTLQNTGILARRNGKPWLNKAKKLGGSSPYLMGGFLGGLLVGLAS